VVGPQAHVLNLAQSMATDSYAFVGSAEAEMKATDSASGELLAEAVDQRAGGMGLKSAASFEWGEAQNAMDYWAQQIPQRLHQMQTWGGTAQISSERAWVLEGSGILNMCLARKLTNLRGQNVDQEKCSCGGFGDAGGDDGIWGK